MAPQLEHMEPVSADGATERRSVARPVGRPDDCSFSESDWAILSRFWFPVARAGDVAAAPVRVLLLDVPLVLYRAETSVSAALDRCPHRGVPLSKGWLENGRLICPYHGLHFDAEGSCTLIPAQPNVTPSARFAATNVPSVERYGLIWVCLKPGGGTPAIPPLPEWEDRDYLSVAPVPIDIAAAPARQIEGFIDVAHFAWVHHLSFADRDNALVAPYKARETEAGLTALYTSSVSNYPKDVAGNAPPGFLWKRVFEVFAPFAAILTVSFPDNRFLRILNVASPVSANRTRLFAPVTRNFDTDGSIEAIHAFNAQIFAEDQDIVETQQPDHLPLDLEEEAHFAADRASILYRKKLKNMGLSLRRVPAPA